MKTIKKLTDYGFTVIIDENYLFNKYNEIYINNAIYVKTIEQTEKYISKLRTIFILDSLDNLAKNGRITNFKALLANIMHIVPIMGEDGEGRIVLKESVRGKKKAFTRLVDMLAEYNIDFENTILGITHVNCLEKAEKLRDDIKAKYNFKDIKIFSFF